MPKQKRGFLLFICSLIPGAGEMYLGFFKQGISIMTLFWAIIAIAGGFSTEFLVIFLPVIWFYSFFHVHNLKELPEEEFYTIEDSYIFHLDQIFSGFHNTSSRQLKAASVLLIVFGAAIVWNSVSNLLYWILPDFLGGLVQSIMYQIPSIVIGLLIIIAGYQILTGKVRSFQKQPEEPEEKMKQEHYWQPYRPYQQPEDTANPPAAPAPAEPTNTQNIQNFSTPTQKSSEIQETVEHQNNSENNNQE